MDVVIITPESGNAKEIGQRLLTLADNPNQVHWVTYPQTGFQVPLELFAKFDADGEEPEAQEEAKPRRRRRSKEPSTDNNTSEEE